VIAKFWPSWDSDPSAPSRMLAKSRDIFDRSDRRCVVTKNQLEKPGSKAGQIASIF
jgi:hypothetical protein